MKFYPGTTVDMDETVNTLKEGRNRFKRRAYFGFFFQASSVEDKILKMSKVNETIGTPPPTYPNQYTGVPENIVFFLQASNFCRHVPAKASGACRSCK